MRITVTYDDIDHGIRESRTTCPIALALARETGFHAQVNVNKVVIFDHEELVKVWELPESIIRIIIRYDFTGQMSPFEFEL